MLQHDFEEMGNKETVSKAALVRLAGELMALSYRGSDVIAAFAANSSLVTEKASNTSR